MSWVSLAFLGRFDDGSLPAFPRCLAPNLQGSLSSSLSLDLVHPVRQTQSSHFRTDHLHVSLPRLQGLESDSNLWLALRAPAPARFSSQLCRWSRMARCSPLAAPAPATRAVVLCLRDLSLVHPLPGRHIPPLCQLGLFSSSMSLPKYHPLREHF